MSQINELLEESLDKLKSMMNGNNVMGEALCYNDITIIPITSIKIGFLSGGSDIKQIKDNPLFGGATSGGVSVTPCGFLVINGCEVNFIAVENKTHIYEKIIDYINKIYDKGTTILKNNVDVKSI